MTVHRVKSPVLLRALALRDSLGIILDRVSFRTNPVPPSSIVEEDTIDLLPRTTAAIDFDLVRLPLLVAEKNAFPGARQPLLSKTARSTDLLRKLEKGSASPSCAVEPSDRILRFDRENHAAACLRRPRRASQPRKSASSAANCPA